MTASELKYEVENSGSNPYFFTRKTMKFFGDTMRNYGVRSAKITSHTEDNIEVWELYRRKPVKHGLQSSTHFRKSDFSRALEKK